MPLSRREFINLSGLSASSLVALPWRKKLFQNEIEKGEFLGRVTESQVDVRSQPDINSPAIGILYEDNVVTWLREVVGSNPYRTNQRWVETPQGYIWSPQLQPVRNYINEPVLELPETSLGPGIWVEVSVPWVDVVLENPIPYGPRVSYLISNHQMPRLYFSQILWVDALKKDDLDQTWYRLFEPYGSYGDVFWGPADAFRPITADDMLPISPEIENKVIEVNIGRQTMSCFENEREVHFSRVSTGRLGKETPLGNYWGSFWKLVSVHMSAGTTGAGYDLTGVGWPTFFAPNGIAIHSTFWHNNFGEPTSAGCVNAKPDDAKFISQWSQPVLPYDPGVVDIGSTGIPTTRVRVIE